MPRPLFAAVFFVLALLPGCNTGSAPSGPIGKPAPPLSIPGRAPGNPLAALQGHVVVLNFWASWCAPCLVEFPALEALQHDLPGITVLAVSFDTDPAAYASFLRRQHIALRTALDTTGRSSGAYGTTRPPETYILDGQGIVRRKFIGAQDWTSPEIEGYLRALH